MACELFGGDTTAAHNAALALEMFHNFTLVHDDIMDNADTRRGKETVHKKYNDNVAILSGDLMLIKSYAILSSYEKDISSRLLKVFNKLAIDLCEGQYFDMEFEERDDVTVEDYIKMIELKTGVLIAGSLQIGAIIGGADEQNANHLYEFGKNLGIAFQLQDDLLDTFGEFEKVGKKIGGDIVQNKKTYLYLKALELADDKQRKLLLELYSDLKPIDEREKINIVTELFMKLVVPEYVRQVRDAYLDLANAHFAAVNIPENNKSAIQALAKQLVSRDY